MLLQARHHTTWSLRRGIRDDGQFTNITWTEMANTSGFIGGLFDWNVDLGVFASGSETYRFRIRILTEEIYCVHHLNMVQTQTAQSIQLVHRHSRPRFTFLRVNSNNNWRNVFDDSWASPKLDQDFRLTVRDIPTAPESAVCMFG